MPRLKGSPVACREFEASFRGFRGGASFIGEFECSNLRVIASVRSRFGCVRTSCGGLEFGIRVSYVCLVFGLGSFECSNRRFGSSSVVFGLLVGDLSFDFASSDLLAPLRVVFRCLICLVLVFSLCVMGLLFSVSVPW